MKNQIENIIQSLKSCRKTGANSYQALCPAHNDHNASLTITEVEDKILLYCHAGCELKNILNALNLKESDLFKNTSNLIKPQLISEYFYTDENGNKLYKVQRYTPKSFRQAKFCNNEWIYNMNSVRYVLYNLPNVIKSDVVYFVEGEKDVNNINKLGLVGTTTVGGASSFKKRALEYSKYLKDKIVYILPDNDKSGYKYADDIKNALDGIAREVKILKLKNEIKDLKEKSDISDIIEKYGQDETLNILERLKNTDYNENVFPIDNSNQLNAESFSKILEFIGIKLKYNVITKRVCIEGMPSEFATSDLYNILPIYIKDVLKNNGIKVNTNIIEEYIILEISKNNFNPFIELLQNNKWDGKDRINEIYNILNLKEDLYKILVKKWLYQTVSIAFNDLKNPYGIDGILTLQGKQGIGKTRFFYLLTPNPEWFVDGLTIDINNKDSLLKATSSLISELGELDSTVKKEQSALKAFLTSAIDDIRPPYGKKSIRRARNTNFCATVNPQIFLKDESRK